MKMKVLITPSWYGSEENPLLGIFFKEQAKALQNAGCKITLLYPEIRSLRYFNHKWKTGMTIGYEDGIKTYRYNTYNPLPERIPYSKALLFSAKLKHLYKEMVKQEGKPDIIHAHSTLWGGWASAKIAQKEGIPLVITEHSSKFVRGLLKPYEINEAAKALNAADKVISVGPSLRKELSKYITKEIKEIPNFVDFKSFQKYKNVSNSHPKKFTFFSLALLTPNKGMDILIKSFAKAFKNNKEINLLIGGDGEQKESLIALVNELDLNSQVHFLGALTRKQVVEYMNKCDVFVLASKFETFGVVLIEALSCGKPIISTDSGGPESIVNHKNGLLVPVNNIDELSNAMIKVFNNYTQYNPEEIRKDCYERFSEEAVIEKIIEIYRSLR